MCLRLINNKLETSKECIGYKVMRKDRHFKSSVYLFCRDLDYGLIS
jgi:hypothetical protein